MHPELIAVPTPWGPLPIYSYGVMLGTSLVVAWFVVMNLGEKKEGFSREVMANCFILTAIVAIVCARLLYIATNLDDFGDPMLWINLRAGGLVAYGGFLGGLLGSWAYLRRTGDSLLGWADVVAPTLGTGLGFTRIGCYLYGCDFGARLETDAPAWLRSMGTFPHWDDGMGSPAFTYHLDEYGLDPLADHSYAVHPTQLYESLCGFTLFAVAMLIWRRRRFRGQVILAVTMLYGLWRFFIEYVRDDPERGFYFGFSTSQLISLALVPVAAFLYYTLRKQQGDAPLSIPTADAKPKRDGDAEEAADAPKASSDKSRKKKRKKRR